MSVLSVLHRQHRFHRERTCNFTNPKLLIQPNKLMIIRTVDLGDKLGSMTQILCRYSKLMLFGANLEKRNMEGGAEREFKESCEWGGWRAECKVVKQFKYQKVHCEHADEIYVRQQRRKAACSTAKYNY